MIRKIKRQSSSSLASFCSWTMSPWSRRFSKCCDVVFMLTRSSLHVQCHMTYLPIAVARQNIWKGIPELHQMRFWLFKVLKKTTKDAIDRDCSTPTTRNARSVTSSRRHTTTLCLFVAKQPLFLCTRASFARMHEDKHREKKKICCRNVEFKSAIEWMRIRRVSLRV